MKRYLKLSALLLLLCLCTGCAAPKAVCEDTCLFAMDTVITLHLPAGTDPAAIRACEAEIRRLEALFSRTDPQSEVSAVNRGTEEIPVSEETAEVLSAALRTAAASDGAYDPTIAPLSVLWDVTGEHPSVPSPAEIAEAKAAVGYEKLTLDGLTVKKASPAVKIDLGGCAKGYACAKAAELLRDAGIDAGIVSFGGNVGVFGEKPDGSLWTVGIRHPDDPSASAGFLSLAGGFVSVSGDYERYFEEDGVRYHHILDPETGYPARSGVRSAAVWSEDAVLADALSTALFVCGPEKALALYESGIFAFEAVFYLADGRTVLTPGLSGIYRHAAADYAPPA